MWEPGKNRTIRVVTPPPIKPPSRASSKMQPRGGGRRATTEKTPAAAAAAGEPVALPLEVLCAWGAADQADVVQVWGLGDCRGQPAEWDGTLSINGSIHVSLPSPFL